MGAVVFFNQIKRKPFLETQRARREHCSRKVAVVHFSLGQISRDIEEKIHDSAELAEFMYGCERYQDAQQAERKLREYNALRSCLRAIEGRLTPSEEALLVKIYNTRGIIPLLNRASSTAVRLTL